MIIGPTEAGIDLAFAKPFFKIASTEASKAWKLSCQLYKEEPHSIPNEFHDLATFLCSPYNDCQCPQISHNANELKDFDLSQFNSASPINQAPAAVQPGQVSPLLTSYSGITGQQRQQPIKPFANQLRSDRPLLGALGKQFLLPPVKAFNQLRANNPFRNSLTNSLNNPFKNQFVNPFNPLSRLRIRKDDDQESNIENAEFRDDEEPTVNNIYEGEVFDKNNEVYLEPVQETLET